ncbi:MAG: protein kinase [Acidobacteriia bacterium]|nr:protein kinase [Terriglobia bacterium]
MNQQRWKRVESIYNAAVGCRPETRAALLQTACDGDDELRREVESLLAQDSKDGPLDHASGRTLGPYQLLEPIGSGGMGTVFKARDTRLDRIVAVKVSTGQFSRRFAVEAQAAAALNHPHVCTLHDVGPNYLVMEFVEGETLAARLQNGPLALERAVEYGAQVADAVAAAHARGVIHRDLKPANIMLTKSGVKVLDFGVAKRVEADETQTAEGAVVGTVAYMAPEQAEGKAVDGRTDIFAFGAVLYEMATGRQAFRGDSTLATLAAVLQKEPPPASLPAELERLIRRCLRKDPDQRFQNMADVKMALEDVHLDAPAGEASRPTGRRWPAPAAVGFGAGFLAACTIWLTAARPPFPDQSQYRFTPFAFDPGGQTGAVWSPGGKAVAYAARGEGGAFQVFLRRLDADAPVQVTQIPEKATPLAWTPDSHRILFQTTREPRGVWSVAAVGGEPEPFFPTADSTVAVAPNGKAAAVLHQGEGGRIGIWISDPAGSPLRKYSPDPFATQRVFGQASLGFSPDGRNILLLLSGGANRQEAWLVPYPPGSGRAPRRVLPDLPSYGRTPGFSWMPDSRRVALSMPAAPEGSNQLWLADTASRSRQALTSGGGMHRNAPAVSPDGRKMAYTEARSNYDVMTAGLDGSAARPLFSTDRNEMMPAWAAKREALVYVTDRNGPQEIWMRSAGADRRLVSEQDFPPDTTRWFVALLVSGWRLVRLYPSRRGLDEGEDHGPGNPGLAPARE